jgi:hypothetical protein
VVGCPTDDGAGNIPVALPKTLPAPTNLPAGAWVFYSDNEGHEVVLGRPGWSCSAGIGADSTEELSAWPPGDRTAGTSVGHQDPCWGCMIDLICPYLPAATAQLSAGAVTSMCNSKRAAGEDVQVRHSGQVALIHDPVGVDGPLVPTKHDNAADAALSYTPDDGTYGATAAVSECSLPAAQQADCTAVLDDFLARRGQLG